MKKKWQAYVDTLEDEAAHAELKSWTAADYKKANQELRYLLTFEGFSEFVNRPEETAEMTLISLIFLQKYKGNNSLSHYSVLFSLFKSAKVTLEKYPSTGVDWLPHDLQRKIKSTLTYDDVVSLNESFHSLRNQIIEETTRNIVAALDSKGEDVPRSFALTECAKEEAENQLIPHLNVFYESLMRERLSKLE